MRRRSGPLRSRPLRFGPLLFGLLWFGSPRVGPLWFVLRRFDLPRFGSLRFGPPWFGLPRFGLRRFGLRRFGLPRFGLRRFGLRRFGLRWFGLRWFVLRRFDPPRFDLPRFGLLWFGPRRFGPLWFVLRPFGLRRFGPRWFDLRRFGPPWFGLRRFVLRPFGLPRYGPPRFGLRRSGSLRFGAVVLVVVALSACGAASEAPSGGSASASVSSEVDPSTYGDPVGVGCAGVPAGEGKGSFVAMRGQNVADAIADNPLLTNFAAALAAESDVAAQLAKANDVTLFVPTDAAFATLPPETSATLLADPIQRAALIDYAVVAERVVPSQLTAALSVPTLAGPDKKLTFALAGSVVLVNGQAQIVCSNILTANATIYLVDKVLLPPA